MSHSIPELEAQLAELRTQSDITLAQVQNKEEELKRAIKEHVGSAIELLPASESGLLSDSDPWPILAHSALGSLDEKRESLEQRIGWYVQAVYETAYEAGWRGGAKNTAEWLERRVP